MRTSQQIEEKFKRAFNLHLRGDIAQARALYKAILAFQPKHFGSIYFFGVTYFQTGDFEAAATLLADAAEVNPYFAPAYYYRGNALLGLKRFEEALASYDKALAIKADYAEAQCSRGNVLVELKQLDEALASYDKALAINPDFAEAYNNRGNLLVGLKRLDEALASYDKALAIKPSYPEAYTNRGVALLELKRLDEALASYDKALAIKPDYADAYSNRGVALLELKRLDEALASYDKALAIKPDYAEAHNNRGNALFELKRLDEALASYDKALAINPDFAEAHNNRGNVLKELKWLGEALASCEKALAIKPDHAEAYNSRGNALMELSRLDEALGSYDKALAIKPDYAEAHNNRGVALKELKRLDEALASYEKALAIKPDLEFAFGEYLHAKMKVCDWSGFSDNLARYEADIAQKKKVTAPFPALGLSDRPDLHMVASQVYAEAKYPQSRALGSISKIKPHGKIRIGYYSSDFRNHALAYLTAELFEAHDTGKFELYGFSFGPDTNDEMRKRVSSAFDKFFDVTAKSVQETALLSRDLGIDIAVDLNGYTAYERTGIFAERCAPIQVSYLGYPGTMGVDYIDYVIADKIVIPENSQAYFTEKVAYLPHSYMVNDSKRKISDRAFTRQELGLPERGFVFCCLNNNYKIQPATFDSWMRILRAVDGSVLWLFGDNRTVINNLRKEAEVRGVESGRLMFAEHMKLDEHLARYRLAELFIDTLPYNAHTTCSDALWAGLPVLTRMGKSFASRVSASLLNALELNELVTETQADYETKAIELALNPDKLAGLKLRLVKNRLVSPLFDCKRFARHMEAAYEAMHRRYQAEEPPAHMYVNNCGDENTTIFK